MTDMHKMDRVPRESSALALPAEMSIEELVARTRKVQEAMAAVMKDGEHYGTIPGTQKPTLLKPGAEKLLSLFLLDPEYDVTPLREADHLDILSRCTLYHIPTGRRVGSGMGSCSTRESKYAYRTAKRRCPTCAAETIQKSQYPPKGHKNALPGWYCYAKVGGCGREFLLDDPAIVTQVLGRVDNPDKADQFNTILKMANKRSLVAAVLNVTAASDIFTQDLEDEPAPARPSMATQEETVITRPDPDPPAEEDARALLGRIEAGFAKLKLDEPSRRGAWSTHCGAAPYLNPNTDVSALGALLADLRARAKAGR